MPQLKLIISLAEWALEGAFNDLPLLLWLHSPSTWYHFHYALFAQSLAAAHHKYRLTSLGIIYLLAHRAVEQTLRINLVHLINLDYYIYLYTW